MGQKVHPHGFRVGVIKEWDAKWYADKKNFADNLVEDNIIRTFVKERTKIAGVSKIQIERAAKRIKLNIFTAKPGMVIGKGGQGIEALKVELQKIIKGKTILINIVEVKSAEADAQLMAENIAVQLEKRISFRRAMKQTIQRAMRSGIKGVKTTCSGRLGGAEIARAESYHEGTIPLQTLRADIDYGFAEADTTYGKIGVKVWTYRGEVLPTKKNAERKKKLMHRKGGIRYVNA
ncbi:30S ribosomal protein S3 [Clostridium tyrobutyricum]|uniref:30S ribosomal protein S3 n=1 Tax=Clostridium tyrobutyricum TaxID=1519 RepID=UPI0003A02747|nr:30S ribosomal protein S3 [Clostridium tyrobutyricum]